MKSLSQNNLFMAASFLSPQMVGTPPNPPALQEGTECSYPLYALTLAPAGTGCTFCPSGHNSLNYGMGPAQGGNDFHPLGLDITLGGPTLGAPRHQAARTPCYGGIR